MFLVFLGGQNKFACKRDLFVIVSNSFLHSSDFRYCTIRELLWLHLLKGGLIYKDFNQEDNINTLKNSKRYSAHARSKDISDLACGLCYADHCIKRAVSVTVLIKQTLCPPNIYSWKLIA